ncbi:hypothetical protein B0J14DRAFT_328599 [Halenospora varia]|nr:hypothetical protein B0J14DRAFT_328599 [Halenospora varia]
MSFGYSVGDFLSLLQLAHTVFQNVSKASGAHSGLARQVNSLQIVLRRLYLEVSKSDSIPNHSSDSRWKELIELAGNCQEVLDVLKKIFEKYNALSEEKRSVKKVWQKVKFGNGEMKNLGEFRSELATYTQAITICLNLLAVSEREKIGKYMEDHSEKLREVKRGLHWITADIQAKSKVEGSVLTNYTGDDRKVWREFRRGLVEEGFKSEFLKKHKKTIIDYVVELGQIGALDIISEDDALVMDVPQRSNTGSLRKGKSVSAQSHAQSQPGLARHCASFDASAPAKKTSLTDSTSIKAKRRRKGKGIAIENTGYEAEGENSEVEDDIVDFWDTEVCQEALSVAPTRSNESENSEDKGVKKKPTEATMQAKNSIQACITKPEESDSYSSYLSDIYEAAQWVLKKRSDERQQVPEGLRQYRHDDSTRPPSPLRSQDMIPPIWRMDKKLLQMAPKKPI